jgi:hypothetical protein
MRMVFCLQIPTFLIGGRNIYLLLNAHRVNDARQIGVHKAVLLVPDPEVEIDIAKLKRYKSPGSNQIPAELIQAGGKIYNIY